MYLIVGLGNPTAKYEKTRHNAGFDVIDAIADKYGIELNLRKGKAFCGTGYIEGQKVMLAKPQTYMNLSGDSVSALVNFYKLDPMEDLIVVFDDISLAPEKRKCGRTQRYQRYYCKNRDGSVCTGESRRGGKTGRLGSGRSCAGTVFTGGQRKI